MRRSIMCSQAFLLKLTLILVPIIGSGGVTAQSTPAFDPANFDIGLEEVASGFADPLYVTTAGDESARLFVVEQGGTIRIVEDGTASDTPYLDITERVGSDGPEQGLLGLAFAPNYTESGFFYVNYTDVNGDTVVSSFTVTDDPNVADSGSETILLQQRQPFPNHNGGGVVFGPDGYLYIGLGDGGSGGDPNGNGQKLTTWLGKILRIDVDPANVPAGEAYAVPDDNPFVGQADAMPEIWAFGLRNPWRFSFDRETGDLWIGDVGQGEIEEIDLLPANEGALNLGWNALEGTNCFLTPECDPDNFTGPVLEYTHDEGGCSVTGGYVYRGTAMPELAGAYIFADFCTGYLWAGGQNAGGSWTMSERIETELSISSFGEDAAGELYLTDHAGGAVYRLTTPG
ncbi:MAG: PQQ-dependent sugar dehydrogenase [Chloroflexia bacterium]|nr:PQQ-dependent sugar dehydrogenase [Chloroflexia bacterium]